MRHQTRLWIVPALPVFFLLTSVFPLSSQILVVEPGCAKAGDTILVTGSGWAEPNPVCEYLFYFDGAEFIARQPDGLFGPPNRTGTIPAGTAAGDHTVKVELRLTSDGSLLQCRQTKIRVVDQIKDPWLGSAVTGTNDGININFDPKDVCDVTPCSKIVFIQALTQIGKRADGTTRTLTYADVNFDDAALHDADLANGWKIDYLPGERDPYYNGDDPEDGTDQGEQSMKPMPATMFDGPNEIDANYPADVVELIFDFEVTGFCAAGTNSGEFLGTLKWRWARPRGGTVTVTIVSKDRNQPSQNLQNALTRWNTNHSFTPPSKTSPKTGGEPCGG